MKTTRYDVIVFSSDTLPATGLYALIEQLPVYVKVYKADNLHEMALCCEKYQPMLVICLLHEYMALNGALHWVYSHQQNYPEIRQLIITSRLLPLFTALKPHLSTVNVASLKTPLTELSWIITGELMGLRSEVTPDGAADIMLPDRQLMVLLMLSWGFPAEQVARRLNITAKTVYAHKLTALDRLQVRNKSDIVDLYAVIDELRMIIAMLRFRRHESAHRTCRTKTVSRTLYWKKSTLKKRAGYPARNEGEN